MAGPNKPRKASPASTEKSASRAAYKRHFGKEPPKSFSRFNMNMDVIKDKRAKGLLPPSPITPAPSYSYTPKPAATSVPMPSFSTHATGPHEAPGMAAKVGNVLGTIKDNRGKLGLGAAGVAVAGSLLNGGSVKEAAASAIPGVVAAGGHSAGTALSAAGRTLTGAAGKMIGSEGLMALIASDIPGIGLLAIPVSTAGVAVGTAGVAMRTAGLALRAASHVALPFAAGLAAYQIASKAHAEGAQAGLKEAGKQALSFATFGGSDLAMAVHDHVKAKQNFAAANQHYTDSHMQSHAPENGGVHEGGRGYANPRVQAAVKAKQGKHYDGGQE